MNTHTALYVAEAVICLLIAYSAWRKYHNIHIAAHIVAALLACGLAVASYTPAPRDMPPVEILET